MKTAGLALWLLSATTLHAQLDTSGWSVNATIKQRLLGQVEYKKDSAFARIPHPYTHKDSIYLLQPVLDSFVVMYNSALKEGITLTVISAGRSFTDQTKIWESKWYKRRKQFPVDTLLAKNILQYSSMPGTSRHHWGTEVDLVSLDPAFYTTSKGKKTYSWLQNNAARYGFFQPYTADPNRTGYREEKWHWSFYPIADLYLSWYSLLLSNEDITGFQGSSVAQPLHVKQVYVMGIGPRK